MSTESIASPQPPASASGAAACRSCGSPLASDQRYCLECGERQPQTSEFLRSGAPVGSAASASPPQTPPGSSAHGAQPSRNNNTVSLLAGVGVLLLALGVGVLIGRSGASSKQSPAPVQVVTSAGGGAAASARSELHGRLAERHERLHRPAADAARDRHDRRRRRRREGCRDGQGRNRRGSVEVRRIRQPRRRRLRDLLGRLPQAGGSAEGARRPEEELPRREGDPRLRKRVRRVRWRRGRRERWGGFQRRQQTERSELALQTGAGDRAAQPSLLGQEIRGRIGQNLPNVVSTG